MMWERAIWRILTGEPAMEVAVTVVSVKLRWDRSDVTYQQDDEAQTHHVSTWDTFAHCHPQKVNIELTPFLRCSKTALVAKWNVGKQFTPVRLVSWTVALTSIKVVQPSFSKSPNPSYPAPSAPFYHSRSCWPQTSMFQPISNWGHPSFQLISSHSPHPTSILSTPVYPFPASFNWLEPRLWWEKNSTMWGPAFTASI